jgi:phenylalanyl-tRNA synthetase beta chain
MKFTLSWLKQFLITDASAEEIIEKLTSIGLEVEEIVNQADIYKNFIIAEIISSVPHPEADKLKICQVNNGKEVLQIVCRAPNARAGIKVVLAPVGTVIPINGMVIKESKIRNALSCGMMCSAKELNLGEDSNGIIELDGKYIVGSNFAENYGLNEVQIELSITPNRGDCLGIYGVARDLAATGIGTLKAIEVNNNVTSFDSPIDVKINSKSCSKYIGRYFKGVNNTASPEWLQKALKSIGINPISSLVDITNYFTFAFSRPMHVFDADLISDIEIRNAQNGEKFIALNDKEYSLNHENLVIADKANILGLAGIIGEKKSGASLETKNVFLEIALFDADIVAKTSRMYQIDTDAKYRFERKLDPEFMSAALELATTMILEICGGEASNPINIDNLNYSPVIIDFPLSELEKRIGISYDKNNVINILQNLGFKVEDLGDSLKLQIPSWRNDIAIKEDIVEEIARIDGYDKITSIPLPKFIKQNEGERTHNSYRISQIAASLGLNETVTWSFMSDKKSALFSELKEELYLKNPISIELNYMRSSILGNLLEAAENNQNRSINSISLFEVGPIFKNLTEQVLTLTGLRVGKNNERNHYKDYRDVDAFDAKSDILNIISGIGFDVAKLQYITENLPKHYHPGRSGALALGKNIIGYFGELHPLLIKTYNLNYKAVGFELFLDKIPVVKEKTRKGALQLSDYQKLERDFAFLIDKNISSDMALKNIAAIDKKLIKNINIFDVYEGKNIEEGKKSIAFSVTIQADDRTLSEAEIENISKNIIDTVIKNTNGILRAG